MTDSATDSRNGLIKQAANKAAAFDDEIDLLELLSGLYEQRILIASITAICLFFGVFYALVATPIYRADVLIQVEEQQMGIPGLDDMSELFADETSSSTEIEVFKSRRVIGTTVDDLQLTTVVKPKYFPVIGLAIARRYEVTEEQPVRGAVLGARSFAWGGEDIKIDAFEVSNDFVDEELVLETTESGFKILFEDTELLSNGQVGQVNNSDDGSISIYVRELIAAPGTEFSLIKSRRLDQVKHLQQNIRVSEKGKKTGILNVTLDSEDPKWAINVLDHVSSQYVLQNVQRMSAEAEKSLKFLRSQLPDVKRELESTENALNEFRTDRRSVDISIETQALLTQIVEIENEISALSLKKTELQQQFKQGHPMFSVLNSQMQQLQAKKTGLTDQVDKLPDTQQKLLQLMRDLEVKTEIYIQLQNKAQELDVIRAGTVGNVRILDEAAVDTKEPIKPKKSLIVALAGVLGVFLGVVAALIRRALNRGVENPEQIENLGIPVYATVPFSKLQPKDLEDKGILLADSHPEDLSVEALRGLRTSIHFALVGSETKSIAITGPSPGVGKTFVSANLSALAAMGGDKVCVVDADMRRGTLHNYFHSPSENGLSELLSGQIPLEQALIPSGIANLDLISRGKAPPNPSELLMGQSFTQLIEELFKRYDLVVIDTPPALAVTDAAVVGAQLGATLLISRQGLNPISEIEYAKNRLEQNGVPVKGAVLNGVKRSASKYSNYSYYQYDYQTEEK